MTNRSVPVLGVHLSTHEQRSFGSMSEAARAIGGSPTVLCHAANRSHGYVNGVYKGWIWSRSEAATSDPTPKASFAGRKHSAESKDKMRRAKEAKMSRYECKSPLDGRWRAFSCARACADYIGVGRSSVSTAASTGHRIHGFYVRAFSADTLDSHLVSCEGLAHEVRSSDP